MKLFNLFKSQPAWKSNNEQKALQAVEAMSDQTELAQIIRNASNMNVRKEALKKIIDQKILAGFAKEFEEYEDVDIAKAALLRLKDKAIIADVARNAKDWDVRFKAVKELTGDTVLARFVVSSKEADTQIDEVERLEYEKLAQEIFADAAKNCDDDRCRIFAAERLTDTKLAQEIFTDVAKSCDSDSYRIFAAKNLTDKAFADECLADVVRNTQTALYSREALAEITDKSLKEELRGIVAKKEEENYAYNKKHNSMPLKCPNCGTVVMLVNEFNMNIVYENYDKDDSGLCPSCGYKYRK